MYTCQWQIVVVSTLTACPCATHGLFGCLLACLTSKQHASVSQGRSCSDHCRCCHTDIDVTSPNDSIVTPGNQSQHWPYIDLQSPGRVAAAVPIPMSMLTGPTLLPMGRAGIQPGCAVPEADALTARPKRHLHVGPDAGFQGVLNRQKFSPGTLKNKELQWQLCHANKKKEKKRQGRPDYCFTH